MQKTTPHAPGRTRVGKVARLPFALREEINHRLADGETALEIISWLNGLPQVAAILASHGWKPLREQNISEWRTGGFQDWLNEPARDLVPGAVQAPSKKSVLSRKKIPAHMQTKFAAGFVLRFKPMDPAEVYEFARVIYRFQVGGAWQQRRCALLARACEMVEALAVFVSLRIALRAVAPVFHGLPLDDSGHVLKTSPVGLFRYRNQWLALPSPETFALHFENCGRKSRGAAQ